MAPITNTHNSYSLFRQAVERTPDTTAVVDLATEQRLTDRELAKRVRRVANGLRQRGIDKGDRVAVCLRNRPEHVTLFLATQAIGAVEVPFNFRLARDGILRRFC
jgi:acyl-CoA synthetase (AMP-forming)/AMP-acid ligase II